MFGAKEFSTFLKLNLVFAKLNPGGKQGAEEATHPVDNPLGPD